MTDLASSLNRLWRLFATAISFSLFGLGGLLLGLVIFPLLCVLQRDAGRRQVLARHCIGVGFSWFIRIMKSLGVLSYEVVHRHRLDHHRGTLIIANHPSLIDVVFLISFFPQAECVIKQAVTRNVFMRSGVAAANYISNIDARDLLEDCTERLGEGANLILFPEATRTEPGHPLQFKPGAAAVAVRAGAPILPILIRCSPTTLTKGEPWYHIPPTKPHWILEVRPAIQMHGPAAKSLETRQEIRDLNHQLLLFYERELAQASSHS